MKETYIYVVQNDIKEDLQFTLQDSSGTAVDLTGASTVQLLIQRPQATALKFTGSMTVVTAASGTCKYNIASGDFDEVGKYYGTIKVTYSSGQIISFPGIIIEATPQLPRA